MLPNKVYYFSSKLKDNLSSLDIFSFSNDYKEAAINKKYKYVLNKNVVVLDLKKIYKNVVYTLKNPMLNFKEPTYNILIGRFSFEDYNNFPYYKYAEIQKA